MKRGKLVIKIEKEKLQNKTNITFQYTYIHTQYVIFKWSITFEVLNSLDGLLDSEESAGPGDVGAVAGDHWVSGVTRPGQLGPGSAPGWEARQQQRAAPSQPGAQPVFTRRNCDTQPSQAKRNSEVLKLSLHDLRHRF